MPARGATWATSLNLTRRVTARLSACAYVLALPGSIRMGLSLALANAVQPGARALSISNGFWGELIGDYLRQRGAEVIELKTSALAPVPVEEVRKALLTGPFDIVSIVHVETNAGIINPIAEIGALVRETEALYLVDTACSAGAQSIETDAWGIDIGVTGSHKCLGSVPGLAILTLSDKTMARLESKAPTLASLDLPTLRREILERSQRPLFTLPPALVHSLSAALEEIELDGMATWFARHEAVAERFREAMRAAGAFMLPDLAHTSDASMSVAVQAVGYPEGFDDSAFRARLVDRHGIHVIGNIGAWQGRSFRLGLMSAPQIANATLERVIAAITCELTA